MGNTIADILWSNPKIWKELTDTQKKDVKDWWRGPNYSFNHNEKTVQELVEFFDSQ